MSRNLLSALAIVAAGSLFIGWKKFFGTKETIIQRAILKSILITLRKRFYSTLRQISFIVKHLKVHQGFSNKKITQILMQNGSSAERKLNAIQEMVLLDHKIQKSKTNQLMKLFLGLDFQYSCVYYAQNDIQIKILLNSLKGQMQMALDGSLSSFVGPLPQISNQQAIQIYKEIIKSNFLKIQLCIGRLLLVQKKYTQLQKQTQESYLGKFIQKEVISQTILLEIEIEQFLKMKGIKDQENKQPCQKILLSILQRKCLENAFFEQKMHQIEEQLQQAIKNKISSISTVDSNISLKENNTFSQIKNYSYNFKQDKNNNKEQKEDYN